MARGSGGRRRCLRSGHLRRVVEGDGTHLRERSHTGRPLSPTPRLSGPAQSSGGQGTRSSRIARGRGPRSIRQPLFLCRPIEGRTVPRLRQSLTSSGTARLGAYGGGAPAAPIVASTLSGEGSVAIDSMASASSIDELLTAHSLFVGVGG